MNNTSENLVSGLLQLTTVHNAIVMGWKVKKIGHHTYVLSKKKRNMNNLDFDSASFLKKVLSSKIVGTPHNIM